MQVLESLDTITTAHQGCWLALGNFDGVHRGHQALVREALRRAPKAGVLTFHPHPRRVFQPDAAPFQLTQRTQKHALLAAEGIARLIELPFSTAFARTTAQDFMASILQQKLRVAGIVVGYDFLFGYERQGNTKLLAAWGADNGIPVVIIPPQYSADGQRPFSSSAIRHAIRAGNMAAAAEGLGRVWTIEATVQTGAQQGRQLGFPTANLDISPYVTPAYGVYAVTVTLPDGQSRLGVANFGVKPTIGAPAPVLEVHLCDFDGILYGERLSVAFHEFIRPERRFASLEALRGQITQDKAAAEKRLLALGLSAT